MSTQYALTKKKSLYIKRINYKFWVNIVDMDQIALLTLKMLRKPASENVVCICHLQNILANFSNLFLHSGKQCGP